MCGSASPSIATGACGGGGGGASLATIFGETVPEIFGIVPPGRGASPGSIAFLNAAWLFAVRTPDTQLAWSVKASCEPSSVQTRPSGRSRPSSENALHALLAEQRLTHSPSASGPGDMNAPRKAPVGIRLPHISEKPDTRRLVEEGPLQKSAVAGAAG